MTKAKVDVAVIGGGAAGLVAAAATAALGARTVLIERDRLGGECTWTGCVPSKALQHIASRTRTIRESERYGLRSGPLTVDFAAAMASVRATRREIYEHGERPDHLKSLGIHPLKATARFLDPRTIEIERDGRRMELALRSAIVASGSRPFVPDIPGLDEIDFLTTDGLYEINELPARLGVLGGGAVGVEMAQAFARLGSNVTLITRDYQLLPEKDRSAADLLHDALRRDGVKIHLHSTIASVKPKGLSVDATISGETDPFDVEFDELLIATGRTPNVSGFGLEAAGVERAPDGITVDDYCRTNVKHIFAAGDVTPAPNLTHVAENMSKAAAINALARLPIWKYEQNTVPMVVYTDPEIATVGRCERELGAADEPYDVIELPFRKIDRAVIEGNTEGFVRVYHRFGRVLGATVAGAGAGELIAEYALAMRHNLRLPALADTVHAYPTMMLGARRAADQIYVRTLKPWMVHAFKLLYGYRGDVPDYVGTRTIV